jgi:hypothetical protein
MEPTKRLESPSRDENDNKRLPYVAPAILFEGKINIRAGSPTGGINDGPPSPFGGPPGG